MSTMFKYRVHEVAKDFKVPTKTVTEILTEYATTPKNHMQALTEEELDLVFEYFTQHNQMDSIEELFAADTAKAAEKKEAKGDKSTAAVGKSEKPASEKMCIRDRRFSFAVTRRPRAFCAWISISPE